MIARALKIRRILQRPDLRRSAGFTMIELLIVIGITALVLSLVFVARPRTAALRVEATARTLAESMRVARTIAMTRNEETVFVFDTQARLYGIGQATKRMPPGFGIDLTVSDTERNGTTGGFRFYPDGQSSGGDMTLSLEGFSTTIVVNWLTGRASTVPVIRP